MKMQQLEKDGVVKLVKVVKQKSLTDECWLVQIFGLGKCSTCEDRGKNCGGKKIRKSKKNSKGIKIPLPDNS